MCIEVSVLMGTHRVPSVVVDFINEHSTIIVAGHKEPDGDCIGSSLALYHFLRRLGKTCVLLSSGPFKRSEIVQYEPFFSSSLPAEYRHREGVGVIIVDCANVGRTGSIESELVGFPTAIIDHHATNEENNPVSFVDPSSPAASLLVQDVIEEISGSVTREEAYFLLFGICTDTGFFRHLDENSGDVFLHVARLVSLGVSPKVVFAQMNGNKSFSSRLLIGRTLSRLSLHYNNKLAVSYQTYEDMLEFGKEGRDTDSLYMLIQAIKGVEAIVVVKEDDEEHCSIGFRSFDKVDVSCIAKLFGGGGHKQASGAYVEGRYTQLLPEIIASFKEALE